MLLYVRWGYVSLIESVENERRDEIETNLPPQKFDLSVLKKSCDPTRAIPSHLAVTPHNHPPQMMIRTLLLVVSIAASSFAHSHTVKKTTLRADVHEQMESKATVAGDGRICSMSNDKTEPSPESLTWCEEYSSSSCCSPAEDKKLMDDFDTYWRSTAGHCPGCLANVKAFQCGYTCGPNQADYTTVKRKNGNGTVVGATLRMCSQFCNSFHASCGNITIAEMEGKNANAFCQGFVRSNHYFDFKICFLIVIVCLPHLQSAAFVSLSPLFSFHMPSALCCSSIFFFLSRLILQRACRLSWTSTTATILQLHLIDVMESALVN